MKTHRFRIRITKTGWLFIGLCLGVGIAGLNTGNNLLYLIFSMMLSFIILSGLLSNNTLNKLRLHPEFSQRIFANEATQSRLTLRNEKRFFSSYAIRLVPISKDILKAQSSFILKLKPKTVSHQFAAFSFAQRGWNELPSFTLNTTFPFGLLEKYIEVSSARKTLAFPEIIPNLKWLQKHQRDVLGETLTNKRKDSGNPFGVRDFVQGDHYKKIHWKSSARTQKLRIKEFESEENLEVHLHLKLEAQSASKTSLREKAISYVSSLLLEFHDAHVPCSLSIQHETYFNAQTPLDTMLSSLALVSAPTDPRESRFRAPASGVHVLVCDHWAGDTAAFASVIDPTQLDELSLKGAS